MASRPSIRGGRGAPCRRVAVGVALVLVGLTAPAGVAVANPTAGPPPPTEPAAPATASSSAGPDTATADGPAATPPDDDAPAVAGTSSTAAAATDSSSSAIDAIGDRLLTVRPSVGPTWVVPTGGLSVGQQVLLRTLQGIVNRTQARLYLTDPSDQGAQRWLDTFQAQGLVTVAGTTDLAGAVDRFAAEASGYVLADPAEPWSVQVASTIAAAEGALVATPAEVPLLEAEGLTLVEDVRGRWPDAATAYEAIVAERGDQLPHAGVSVLRPDDRGLDFAVQQGMLVLFSRPGSPDWARISALLTDRPAGTPVFGYLSDNGDEEAIAVGTLAAAGLVLVPTDTTRNLSYQLAVGADRPRQVVEPVDPATVAPCAPETLNVVVGLTDGDNANVPLNRFSGPDQWGSNRRGELPLGWSMTPSLAVLAPAVWDTYVREATDADELVGMIGWAYGAPSLMPDAQGFYEDSFALMDQLGLRTFWSLGGGLETAGTSGWRALDAAAVTTASSTPHGVLVGYGGGSGVGRAFHSPAGRPAFTSGSAYMDTPTMLAGQLEALLARPSADRPLVSFLAATNWSNPAAQLIAALAPFRDRGVRFLTPAEAAACTPPPTTTPPPEAGPGECLPSAPPAQHGLALISDATAADMVQNPTPTPVGVTVSAPATATAGEDLTSTAVITVDLPALAASVLDERVRPLVSAGYGPELAATAWLEVALADLVVQVPTPPGTVPTGTPTVTSGPGTARWGTDALELRVPGPLSVDSRSPGTPTTIEVAWSVAVPADAAAFEAVVAAARIEHALDLTIGVMLGAIPLTGGAAAPWTCTPATEPLARTTVAAAPPPDLQLTGGAQAAETAPATDTPYLFGLTNAGPGAALAAVVTFEATPGTVITSATFGWLSRRCAVESTVATCTLGTLPAGRSTFLVLSTRSTALGPVEVVGTATSAGIDADPTDDATTATVEVVSDPGGPAVTPSVVPRELVTGEAGAIVVGVHRTGPRPASDVVVQVTLPEGVTVLAAARGWFSVPCSVVDRTATCTLPRLAADTFVVVTVRPTSVGPTRITATATAADDTDPSDDTATADLDVRDAAT